MTKCSNDPALATAGVGPSVAIPDVVRRGGISIEDVDVFELNEAFASQVHANTWSCFVGSMLLNDVPSNSQALVRPQLKQGIAWDNFPSAVAALLRPGPGPSKGFGTSRELRMSLASGCCAGDLLL
jgi:Thiolase, C-terminal domain